MSKKNKKNLTRQGVRDLNHIKAKSVGIRLEMPPSEEIPEARNTKRDDMQFDDNWMYDGKRGRY